MAPDIPDHSGNESRTQAPSPGRLMQLMLKHQKGHRPAFQLGPFLPILPVMDRGFSFNQVFKEADAMTVAARISLELGFESTVVPFDMNVEAEVLGARIIYHEGFEGHPVYPTVSHRPVARSEDLSFRGPLERLGRIPVILNTIATLKETCPKEGAVGAFIPGPFTLAGQVMEPEALFKMLLKAPNEAEKILKGLSDFINALKSLYADSGIDFITVEEGGAAGVSPSVFGRMLLPHLQSIFSKKPCPMALSMIGGTDSFLDHLLACDADGIQIDGGCDTTLARKKTPDHLPLFTGCGVDDLLAGGDPETIALAVRERLDRGATSVAAPADIYPAAKRENIEAFVMALTRYEKV